MPVRDFPTNRPSKNVRTRRATIASVDPDDVTRYFINIDGFEGAEPARWYGSTPLEFGTSVVVEVAPELKAWRILPPPAVAVAGGIISFFAAAPVDAFNIESAYYAGWNGDGSGFTQSNPLQVKAADDAADIRNVAFWFGEDPAVLTPSNLGDFLGKKLDVPPNAHILTATLQVEVDPGSDFSEHSFWGYIDVVEGGDHFDDDSTARIGMSEDSPGSVVNHHHYTPHLMPVSDKVYFDVTTTIQNYVRSSGYVQNEPMVVILHGEQIAAPTTEFLEILMSEGALITGEYILLEEE